MGRKEIKYTRQKKGKGGAVFIVAMGECDLAMNG